MSFWDGAKDLLNDALNRFGNAAMRLEPTTFLSIDSFGEKNDHYAVSAIHFSDTPVLPYYAFTNFEIDLSLKSELKKNFSIASAGSGKLKTMGKILYDYFLDDNIREYIRKFPPKNLIIMSTNEQDLPWEYTFDDENLWYMKYNMSRILGANNFRKSPEAKQRKGLKIAIISNPENNLQEADKEAEAINDLLTDNKDIEVSLFEREDANKTNIITGIKDEDYDIIHYIGHAEFNENDPNKSALVLHDGKKWTTNEIRRSIFRYNPIFFANACSTSANKFVGNKTYGLASAFIDAGTIAYIGTMYFIRDYVAADFAVNFYRNLTSQAIGASLKDASMSISQKYDGNEGIVPYTFYGDPRYFLPMTFLK